MTETRVKCSVIFYWLLIMKNNIFFNVLNNTVFTSFTLMRIIKIVSLPNILK